MSEQKTDAVNVETASKKSKLTQILSVLVAMLAFLGTHLDRCDYFQTSKKVEKTVGTLAPKKDSVVRLEERLKNKASRAGVAVVRNDVKHLSKKLDGVQHKVDKLQSTVMNGFYQIQQALQKRAAARPRAMPDYRYRKRVYTRPRR